MSKFLRFARFIEIIHLISTRSDWTPKKLATYFEISEKRIYDDISELNAANIPIVFEEDGYKFLTTPKIPAMKLLKQIKDSPCSTCPYCPYNVKRKRNEHSEEYFGRTIQEHNYPEKIVPPS
ncbi:MAG: HTH domain-containing protein [bacterium]